MLHRASVMELCKLLFALFLIHGAASASVGNQANEIAHDTFATEISDYVSVPKTDERAESPASESKPVKEDTYPVFEVPVTVNAIISAKPVAGEASDEIKDEQEEGGVKPVDTDQKQDAATQVPPSLIQSIQSTIQNSTIYQNLQQGIQNLVRPSGENSTSPPRPTFVQQAISNLQQGVRDSIQNVSQAIQNFVNRPPPDFNGTSPTLVQQTLVNLQQSFQTGIQNLNQTFQDIASSNSSNVVQSAFQNVTAGIQNAISPSNDEPSNSTSFVQTAISNFQNLFQQGVNNVNQTVQNLLNPQQTTNSGERPSFIQALQGLFRPQASAAAAATTSENVRQQQQQQLNGEIDTLNQLLHEGIKNITENAPQYDDDD